MEKAVKQAIIIRKELKMGTGKIASQTAHASLMSFLKVYREHKKIAEKWLESGEKKIVLKTTSTEEFEKIKQEIVKSGLPFEIVNDMGLTQVEPGTETAIGIGPWLEEDIDRITGKLKLL